MSSYKSIIKSTGVIAFVQIFKILFVFIQNKVLALIVGTYGYGVYGLYYTFSTMISSFSTLGVDQAGVRQIAKNNTKSDFSKSLWTLKCLLFFLSLLTFIIIFFLRNNISYSLFGSKQYATGVTIVGLAIFFNGLSQGYISILNGVQKLKFIAFSQIFGIASSSLFAFIFIYYYQLRGIPYFILLASVILFFFSFFYVNKLKLAVHRPNFLFFKTETKTLLSIGSGLAYSAVIVSISSYFSQIYIRKSFGLEWVGMYNASNIISNVYLGIILTAMGVDLMPRLAKVVNDDIETSNLINFQIEFGLILSTTGIVTVIAFAPQFLSFVYSSKFIPASGIIKWQIMAAALKILSYPLGYILIVRKKTIKYIIVQTVLWGGSYIFLLILANFFGVKALGADFFLAFIIYIILMYFFTKQNYKVSKSCKSIFLVSWVFIILAVLLNTIFPISSNIKFFLNFILLVFSLIWSNNCFKKYLKIDLILILRNKLYKGR